MSVCSQNNVQVHEEVEPVEESLPILPLPQAKYETIREIGDGMHATIYLAEKKLILNDEVVDKQ